MPAKSFFDKFAVLREFGDTEIVGAVFRAVGDAFLFQLGDEFGHFLNVLGGAHQFFRTLNIQRTHVFKKRFFVFARVLLDCLFVTRRIADDLVIHVSNIHDVLKLEAALAQKTTQDIDCDKRTEVADMAVVIDGRAAGIHANGIVRGRGKLFHFAGERVVESERQTEIVAKTAEGGPSQAIASL